MKLDTYLRRHEITAAEFALAIGVTRQAIYHYLGGKRQPSRPTMRKITAATSGAVKRKDFNGRA